MSRLGSKIGNGLTITARVAGVLLSVSMGTTNYDHLQGLKKNGIPIIFFDRHCEIPGNSNVLIDDLQSGYDATEHLISNGCEVIAHFSGPKKLKIYQNRLRGYRKALKKHNKSLLPAGVREVLGDFEAGSMVRCMDANGGEIARGVTCFSSDQIRMIMGRHSDERESVLGTCPAEEVIHRDDLVISVDQKDER